MATQHYHTIIAGDAPAGRLAGIFLGREGSRVLHLSGFGWPTYLLWQSSSLFDKLLDKLQGRTCLTAPLPIQYHHRQHCCEIHGSNPWRDEIRRELPDCYTQIIVLLDQLAEWGHLLQESLYQLGANPAADTKTRLIWKLTTLRKGVPAVCRKQSLAGWLATQQVKPETKNYIAGLLSCYALDLPEQMRLAEAALIWSQLTNTHMIAPTAFNSILSQRLTDSGAETRPAFELSAIHQGPARTLTCTLGKDSVTCDALIIAGQPGWVIEGWPAAPQHATRPALWHLDHFTGKASRLLAPRLLVDSTCGGFQVGIGQQNGEADVFVRTGTALSETTELKTEMTRLFPFSEFLPMLKETGTPGGKRTGPCGEQIDFRLKKNILIGSGAILYPTIGPLGEAMTAMGLISQLKMN